MKSLLTTGCTVGCTAVCSALLLLSACASTTGSAEPDLGEAARVTSAAELTLPFDAYRLSPREYTIVRRAQWRLVKDCIERFDGEYTLEEADAVDDIPRIENRNARRYGVFDAEGAATRGYNAPPEYRPGSREKVGWNPSAVEELLARGVAPRAVDEPDAPSTTVARPTDRAGHALPEDGCEGEADRALVDNAPAPGNPELAEDLSMKANKEAEGDSRVRAAMGRWSDCMKRSGYTYADVWGPNDKSWPEPAGDEEISTAKADVACKIESNLVGVWLNTESAYQKRHIEQNAEALAAVQKDIRSRSTNAARLVGGS